MAEIKRLYRSRSDRILGGVCGGMGKYFGVDSNFVCLLFGLLVFAGVQESSCSLLRG